MAVVVDKIRDVLTRCRQVLQTEKHTQQSVCLRPGLADWAQAATLARGQTKCCLQYLANLSFAALRLA
jgi:hypothetical protein